MSELDELEEIVDSIRYHPGIFSGSRFLAHKRTTEACRRGHLRTEANTRWYKPPGKVRQRICLDCKRANDGFKGVYKVKRK